MEIEEILALDVDGLTAAIADRRTQLDQALAVESPSLEQVEAAEALDQELAALEAEMNRRQEAADRFSQMRDRRAQQAAAAQEQERETEEEDEEEEEEPEAEPEAVTAAARASALGSLRGRQAAQPPAEQDEDRVVTITAAADVPNLATGSQIPDMARVAQAVIDRSRGFPAFSGGTPGGQLHRFAVASFAKPFEEELTVDSRMSDPTSVFARAADERRLAQPLTAAGWCIPSETLFDLGDNGASTDGLFDLPEVQVRGGIRYTSGPDFSTLYEAGFTQTEAQAIAGETKPCFDIECPDFEEHRLDAIGICVKVPILTNAAWPELVSSFIGEAMVAHQHRVSNYLLTRAVAAAGAARDLTGTFNTGSAAGSILSGLEFVIEQRRSAYRLGVNTTMEVALPMWVKGAIRADLAHRNGVDMVNVTDQMIVSWFAARHARPQFLYNWQEIPQTNVGYPETVQALVYPAGTFIRGSAPVISLDAVYDAASLSVNKYTGLFFEEGILLATRRFTPTLVTMPVSGAGRTGAADNTVALTQPVAP